MMMMEDLFKGSSRLETAMWAAKVLLLCAGTVSTVVFFKAAIIPYLLNLSVSAVPHLWTSFKSTCCLSPLYIYIILNFIIITIVASSSFQRQNQKHHHPSSSSSVASPGSINHNAAAKTTDNLGTSDNYIYSAGNHMDKKYNSSTQSQSQSLSLSQPQHTIQSHSTDDDTLLFSSSSHENHHYSNREMISCPDIHIVLQADNKVVDDEEEEESIDCVKPLTTLSTSTMNSVLSLDHSPETCSGDSFLTDSCNMPTEEVDVGGDNMNTLDTTWKAIMEGQGKAIGKQLRKSDTWDTPPRSTRLTLASGNKEKGREHDQLDNFCKKLDDMDDDEDDEVDAVTWARRELKKSDTFSDRVSLRREKSMTQDELNQRAEAFIKKFNNDIRLQRLESDQRRFREMVHSGI